MCMRVYVCVFMRAFVHCWHLHGLVRWFRDVFVVFQFWSPAATMLCSALSAVSPVADSLAWSSWSVHAGQPNLMKPNAKKQRAFRRVDKWIWIWGWCLNFAAALCVCVCMSVREWVCEIKWGGEEREVWESSVSHFIYLAVVLMLPPHLPTPLPPPHPSGSQLSPGGSGATSSLSGG